jgi:hypothetical protein
MLCELENVIGDLKNCNMDITKVNCNFNNWALMWNIRNDETSRYIQNENGV